jgi:hypothetical protein
MATATDEFVVSFRAEGAQELEKAFRTTSSAASDAGDRVKSTTQSFSRYRSATDSVLEGQRRVQTNLKNLALDLSTSTSATDALRTGALRLSEVFKIGIIPAVAIGGGALVFGKINEQVKATVESFNALQAQLRRPLFEQAALGADALVSELQNITKATDDLIKKRNSFGGRLISGFSRGRDDITESIVAGQRRQKDLTAAIADQELRVSNIKSDGLDISEHQAALDKIQLDSQERLAKLHLENSLTKPGRDALSLFKRDAAARQDADEAILQEGRRAQAVKETVEHAKDLANIDAKGLSPLADKLTKLDLEVRYRQKLLDLARTLEQKDRADADLSQAKANKTNAVRQAGLSGLQTPDTFAAEVKATIQSLQPTLTSAFVEAQKRSFAKDASDLSNEAVKQGDLEESERLHRIADTLEAEADAIKAGRQQLESDARQRLFGKPDQAAGNAPAGSGDFNGVASLANLDFTNMKELADYDFSGLAPLSGLSITIA